MNDLTGPDAPAPPADQAARLQALAAYLRANREIYTSDALARAARDAGYTQSDIDSAIDMAGVGTASVAGPEQRARARTLVIAIYGITFLGYAAFVLSKPSALQYGWGIIAAILGVTLGVALLLSLRTIRRSSPRAATAGGAIAAMMVLPIVFLLVVTGLCVATTVPVGLLS